MSHPLSAPRVVAAMAVLALLALPGVASADRNDILEVTQASPVATAVGFSQATFDTADEALLGRDDLFADSLASGGLQGTERPLLLTDGAELDPAVVTELNRLGVDTVTVLGGTSAIDDDVVDALDDAGFTVQRREGTTRTETAIAVAEDLDATTALLVRAFPADGGDDTQAFADSIAAGAWAAAEGWPVLFTQTEVLTTSTEAYLADAGITDITVIGGETAISSAVTDALDELSITWDRVSGSNRFATATAIAAARGFDSEADADRVVLVEGQADDAWVAGFTAAAHAAANDAPIVLANGEDLAPETEAFLSGSTYAVDEDDVDGVVLVCATDPAACDAAAAELGLPTDATLTITTTGAVEPGGQVEGTLDDDGQDADLVVDGCQLPDDSAVTVAGNGAFAITLPAGQQIDCTLTFTITFPNGTVQAETTVVQIDSPVQASQTGQIVAFNAGADTYTFVTDAGTQVTVNYDTDDTFRVQGNMASALGFEGTVGGNLGNRIRFSDDTSGADLDLHELLDVGPITSGPIGNVDTGANSFDFVEPTTDTVLRTIGDYTTADGNGGYHLGNTTKTLLEFADELNEGDSVAITGEGTATERMTVTNGTVQGTAMILGNTPGVDLTLRINGRGDVPTSNNDTDFVAEVADTFTGSVATTFADFETELDDGDTVTYSRTGGVETFVLANTAPPTVTGTVTDNSNPGIDLIAYLANGGSNEVTFTYTAPAFRLNNAIVAESELDGAVTPGDTVSYTPDDPNTGANEELIAITDANLTGTPVNVDVPANEVDVRNAAGGTIATDLDYTVDLYGGGDVRYYIGGGEQTEPQFETALGTVDAGSVITFAPLGGLGTRVDLTP